MQVQLGEHFQQFEDQQTCRGWLETQANHLVREFADDARVRAELSALNAKGCKDPLDPGAVDGIASNARSRRHIQGSKDDATARVKETFIPQPLNTFMKKPIPAKTALIEGVLFQRDRIAFIGRRRHGKTTFLSNLALAGAQGRSEYLGFRIPRPFKTVALFLEDDPGEMQVKLAKMRADEAAGSAEDVSRRLHLYTREDLTAMGIPINISDRRFQEFVGSACVAAEPDLIIADNLGQLIGADYNNPTKIHALAEVFFGLAWKFNAAFLIAVHPRKDSRLNNDKDHHRPSVSLVKAPEMFFEEAMGSSHFINSMGSLWGIERDYQSDRTNLVIGAQRVSGTHTTTVAEKNDADWFQRIDDLAIGVDFALNTRQRRKAWKLLPEHGFKYKEAQAQAKSAISSSSTFNHWFQELQRYGLLVPYGDGREALYRRTVLPPLLQAAIADPLDLS